MNARAYRLQKLGRHAEAEPLLRRAVDLKPDFAYAHYNLGWSLVEQGKAQEAIGPLSWSSRLQPGRWEPYQRLSEAYSLIGDSGKAIENARKARLLRGGKRETAWAKKSPVPEVPEPEPEIEPIIISK